MRIRVGGSVLNRKLLRDLGERKMVIVVITAIVLTGIGSLVGFKSVYRDLLHARDDFYREYRLCDFILDLKRAPEDAVRLVAATPNVAEAEGRVAIPALLDLPSLGEPITGLALSAPEVRRPILNDLNLRTGAWFSGRDEREAILIHSFAEANGLRPGDRIKVLLLDQQHEVLVVGTAEAPEFVYVISPDGGFAPDPGRYGVMFMPQDFLQRSGDLEGAFNQIIGRVHDARETPLDQTLDLLVDRLDSWGVTDARPSADTPSVQMLNDELRGLKASSTFMPTIFLVVALLILNVLLNRMVMQQRTVIGTLKALGRSNFSIVMHFMGYGLAIGLLGGVFGCAMGMWLERSMLGLYAQFYALPNMVPGTHSDLLVLGMFVSVLFACLGTINGVRGAARLDPAEAMRPPPPEKWGRIWLERFPPLWNRLSFRWRLVIRGIFRNPFRSGVSLSTSLVATALMLTTFDMVDGLDYLMDYQFNRLAHEDISVSVREPLGVTAPYEFGKVRGIETVEPQLNVVCDMSNGPHKKRTAITGLPPGNKLYTPLDDMGLPIPVPKDGLVLSRKLAEMLDVGVGDPVLIRPLIARRETVAAAVTAVVDTYLGISAYADISYLSRLLGEEWVANHMLGTDLGEDVRDATYRELKTQPAIISVTRRERAFTQLQETFGESQGAMLVILIGFAGLIAFGSMLNNAFVSLSEREREVGVFRVMGYTAGEVAAILRGELVILSVLGIAFGLYGGVLLTHLLALAYNTEMYRFPVVIHPYRVVMTALLMCFFIGLAQVIIRRIVAAIRWQDVINVKE